MTKSAFDKIAAGMQDAIAFAEGTANLADFRVHVPEKVDVKSIRESLHLSQAKFGKIYAIPTDTLQAWEQNRREPDTTTRAYLTIIERLPLIVADALRKQTSAPKLEKIKVEYFKSKIGKARKVRGSRSHAAKSTARART